MALQNLQSIFFADLLNQSSLSAHKLASGKRLTAIQRLAVYQEAYLLRLIEALADNYPALNIIAGDELFEAICLEYCKEHPSGHFSIRYFGQNLPQFLADHPQYKQNPVLIELAQFEWSLRNAFDGPNANLLHQSDLARFTLEQWPSLHFQVIPTFQTLNMQWNVPQLWKAAIQNESPITPSLEKNAVHWIIWRPALETKFRSIDTIEFIALQQLLTNANFAELCDALAAHVSNDPAQTAANLLLRWLEDGLLSFLPEYNQIIITKF